MLANQKTDDKKINRIMLAAPSSGSGKTLLTCGLIGALQRRNIDVVSCKCGPDYIDPMFHRSVLQIPSENLDTFFTEEETTREVLAEFANGHEFVVMEGVMGLFDGLGGTMEQGSSYHLAKVTQTPIILVVDVHGMGRTMIPLIQGILAYDKNHLIQGVILNRITKGFYETMRPLLQQELFVPVVGIMENHKDLHLESRHLGLIMPEERVEIKEQLDHAAEYLEETVEIDRLLAIAASVPELEIAEKAVSIQSGVAAERKSLRLGVAQDEAFCFYYEANRKCLEAAGIELVPFSPIHDAHLPEGISGLYLGGGYPENHAEALSRNQTLRQEIKEKINQGMPSIAECGGFLYLHQELEVEEKHYPMAGVLDATARNMSKLVRFGYVEIREKEPMFLGRHGMMKGHEFHYFDSTQNGTDCIAIKPVQGKSWDCVHVGKEHWWGFPHLYFPSCPDFVKQFAEKMKSYLGNNTGFIISKK